MRVLWVKSGGFLPLDTGGKIRSYSLLKELAARHEMSVFTFYPQQNDDRHSELEAFCKEVALVPLTLPGRASLTDMMAYAKNLTTPIPYPMAKYCRPETAQRLRGWLGPRKYDAIICDYLITSAVIPWDIPCPKIVFTHNVEQVIWERHWRISRNPLFKAISWREYRTMARAEEMYLQRADHVLTVSDADRSFFTKIIDPDKITTIPTGVDVEYFSPVTDTAKSSARSLVFTGSMDWLPNEDAIVYFCEEIFPIIRQKAPEVQLLVVGRQPTRRLKALAESHPEITLTGTVPDIRPFVRDANVYVVPLRIGGGTRIKIFEAMAMGKPVVSTSLGAEGLPVTHGQDIVIADTPQAFAAAVLRLLASTDEQKRIGRAARQLVEGRYSWSAVTDVFDSALAKIARERQPESQGNEVYA